ncbi:inhibitor of nuclear factor kappa-B kinase-interacting protein isoform X1 [Paramisgurnus dabryanus]|uniref:inhibitor of nuclear factor kappa-B kinase-interacting protein isoform X1 n=1 Tax=Paramisgurnus dabryanus TaxID=90735 RepID=UPI0031F4447C
MSNVFLFICIYKFITEGAFRVLKTLSSNMQSGEIKQRKKTSDAQENGKKRKSEDKVKDEVKREAEEKENTIKSSEKSSDVKLVMSLMSLAVSLVLMCALYQQNVKFAEMKEQYEELFEKTRGVLELQSQMTTVSEKCDRVQALMSGLERSPPVSQLKSLDAEVSHLKERFSNFTGQRHQLQQNLTHLILAVENVENRSLVISSEVMSKVASVRTDLRRMGGLEGEVEALVSQTDTLEEKVTQIEKLMIKRIGDLLASSIDRISGLKSSTESSAQRLDQIGKLVQGLSAADRQLSDRILTLESAQAKMLKMTTFATDLKPKVFTIRQDFTIIESKLSELTLRIGQIAEDVMRGEEELAEMKKSSGEIKYQTLEQKDLLTT